MDIVRRRINYLISPDDRYLAYGVLDYDEQAGNITRLILCKLDGKDQREVRTVLGHFDEILWFGNDRLICSTRYSLDELSHYHIVSIDGSCLPDIHLPSCCNIIYKRISPDGQRVAFVGSLVTEGNQLHGLFVVELKTGNVRCIIDSPLMTAPSCSPDSSRLAIGNSPGYVQHYPLAIVDVETGVISDTGMEGVGASWSPDGKFLAFTTEIVRGGGWLYGIPMDGRVGVLDLESKKLIYISPPARNNYDEETGSSELDGSLEPIWSPDGEWIAYRRMTVLKADKRSEPKRSEEIWIVRRDGEERKKIIDGEFRGVINPVAWAQDSNSLFIVKESQVDRVDLESLSSQTLVSWERPSPPKPSASDTIIIERPGVLVKITWIDRAYGEAFAAILSEARREYEETFGLSLPEILTLEAKRDPQGNVNLWTDGESYLFLTITSKRQLAPSPQTGIFHVYGMCHEPGHIALYSKLKSLIGLPEGVGEGWAHYAGSAVVDEVAHRLGQRIWPEPYDVAAIEGLARLREQVEGKEWAELDAVSRASKVFYEIEKRHGRQILASAFKRSLLERPSGRELMNLFVQSLREFTNDPNAGNWIPREVLVPETKWNVKERKVDEGFFADASVLSDDTGVTLCYGNGTSDGRWSITGAGHAVLFRRPEGEWLIDRIDVFGSRYGSEEPPDEDFTIYLCDEEFELLYEFRRPYGLFERGDDKWYKIPIDPVSVPQRFYVCLSFNPTYTKGIYVAYDEDVGRSHSRLALPYTYVNYVEGKYDWMIRVHLQRNTLLRGIRESRI